MPNLKRFATFLLILAAFSLSCTKLDRKAGNEGGLPIISLNQSDSIPLDWGKLVSTTISPDDARLVLLWFQNEKGDIHLASYQMAQNKLTATAAVIRRD